MGEYDDLLGRGEYAEPVVDVKRAVEVLRSIRDDVNTPMSTAADISQVLVEYLGDRDG